MGGFTMYILLLCSVLSLGVIIDRLGHLREEVPRAARRLHGQDQGRAEASKDMERALEICRDTEAPFAKVVQAGLEKAGRTEKLVARRHGAADRHRGGQAGAAHQHRGHHREHRRVRRAVRDRPGHHPGVPRHLRWRARAAWTSSSAAWPRRSSPRPRASPWRFPPSCCTTTSPGAIERFVDDMELAASEVADLIGR